MRKVERWRPGNWKLREWEAGGEEERTGAGGGEVGEW